MPGIWVNPPGVQRHHTIRPTAVPARSERLSNAPALQAEHRIPVPIPGHGKLGVANRVVDFPGSCSSEFVGQIQGMKAKIQESTKASEAASAEILKIAADANVVEENQLKITNQMTLLLEILLRSGPFCPSSMDESLKKLKQAI